MTTRRRLHSLLTIAVVGIAMLIGCQEQQPKPTIAIMTFVSYPILDQSIHGIKESLRGHGYDAVTAQFYEVNANGQGDLVKTFATELVSKHPDVIVPVSTPVTEAVFNEAPPTQAIVFSTVTNPSDVGMDKSPPNMTGVSDVVNYEANLDLIRELFPSAKTIGIIYNPGERNSQYGIQKIKELAPQKSFQLLLVPVAQSSDIADAARSILGRIDVFYVGSDNTVASGIEALVSIASERHKAVIASDAGSVAKGAMAAVSVDYDELGHKVGDLVAQVLQKKQKPGQIAPVLFVGHSLVLNTKAAEKLNFRLSESLVKRATKIY